MSTAQGGADDRGTRAERELTLKAAAELTGVTVKLLRRSIREGRLQPASMDGNKLTVTTSGLREAGLLPSLPLEAATAQASSARRSDRAPVAIPVAPDRLARDRAERDRIERERAERARADRERGQREKEATAIAERDRVQREEAEKLRREQAHREQSERDRVDRDRSERERLERQKAERAGTERQHRERVERERIEKERTDKLARDKADIERRDRDKAERDRLERERAERERRDRTDRDRRERERAEKESAARREAALKAEAERASAARKEREEAERMQREESARKEREEAGRKEREEAARKERDASARREPALTLVATQADGAEADDDEDDDDFEDIDDLDDLEDDASPRARQARATVSDELDDDGDLEGLAEDDDVDADVNADDFDSSSESSTSGDIVTEVRLHPTTPSRSLSGEGRVVATEPDLIAEVRPATDSEQRAVPMVQPPPGPWITAAQIHELLRHLLAEREARGGELQERTEALYREMIEGQRGRIEQLEQQNRDLTDKLQDSLRMIPKGVDLATIETLNRDLRIELDRRDAALKAVETERDRLRDLVERLKSELSRSEKRNLDLTETIRRIRGRGFLDRVMGTEPPKD